MTQDVRQIPKGLRNSFLVATGTVLINLIFATLAAYTFARERFRGGQAAFTFILGSRLLPSVAVAVPIYVGLRNSACSTASWASSSSTAPSRCPSRSGC